MTSLRRSAAPAVLAALVGVLAAGPTGASAAPALTPIPAAPFSLQDGGTSATGDALVRPLRRRMGASVLDVLARAPLRARPLTGSPGVEAVPNLAGGFRWAPGDESTSAWYPQGITGSWDASARGVWRNRTVVLVSWYSTQPGAANQGARITFVVRRRNDAVYRHVLLAEPVPQGRRVTIRPLAGLHAGGIAWYGRWLYVVDTQGGLRVFDVNRLLRMASRRNAVGCGRKRCYAAGYRYVLPQVAFYRQPPGGPLRFSFVSVDRTSTPHSLLTGEYRRGQAGGRLVRWRLDPATGRLQTGPDGTAAAWQAYSMSVTNVQGAIAIGERFLMSASAGVNKPGLLYAAAPGASAANHAWAIGPEDLSYWPQSRQVFGLGEHPGSRAVFAVSADGL